MRVVPRRDRHLALWAALALVVVGRALLFTWPLYPDEAGFHLVAQEMLRGEGDELYDRYWVDRPPVLVWLFSFGALLGHVLWTRVLATLVLLVFVALVWAAVRRLDGRAGWAAFAAAAFAISPFVGAETANGEAFAVPFVVAGLYAVLRAVETRAHRAGFLWALAAGVSGALAASVKQNFADVFVFALVLVVGLGLRRQRTWATVGRLLAGGVAGGVLVVALLVGWTLLAGGTLGDLWHAVVTFRLDASGVLAAGGRTGIEGRRVDLGWRALAVGLAPFLAIAGALAVWTRFRVSALSYAVGVLIMFEVFCIVSGGNFWPHYLMGLAPGVALAVGVWGRWRVVRWAAAYMLVAALASIPLHVEELTRDDPAQAVGRYVGAAAGPGDTLTTMYGQSDLQWASGMASPYRHLWSLPVRVLDPDLNELAALLGSDEAPTWLVQTVPRHSWGLDPAHRIDAVMKEEYDFVWEGCRTLVWLRAGVDRQLPDRLPTCAR